MWVAVSEGDVWPRETGGRIDRVKIRLAAAWNLITLLQSSISYSDWTWTGPLILLDSLPEERRTELFKVSRAGFRCGISISRRR